MDPAPPSSVPPKILEAVGRHVGVPDRVLNVLVPEVVLQGARVVAIVGELEPTGMAKHVRVDGEWYLGGLPEALDEPVETDGTDWPAALGNEYVGVLRVLASQLAESPHLVTSDRMYAGNPVLRSRTALGIAAHRPLLVPSDEWEASSAAMIEIIQFPCGTPRGGLFCCILPRRGGLDRRTNYLQMARQKLRQGGRARMPGS